MPSPKRIGKIEFGLLSPKEIRTMSVRKIIWADTYDDDGFPYPQGLMDLNLGVIATSSLQSPLYMSGIHG
jgi:DNA-directed RNA polymerase subunit A'